MRTTRRYLRVFAARIFRRCFQRVTNWAYAVLEEHHLYQAERAFPPGCTVRLKENGCCRVAELPENREGTWHVERYTSGGDYTIRRAAGGPCAFAHAAAMERV